MESPGERGPGERGPPRASLRRAADDPLLREVRWRLFRRDELPARLRRLQRLEDAALRERNGAGPDGPDASGDDAPG